MPKQKNNIKFGIPLPPKDRRIKEGEMPQIKYRPMSVYVCLLYQIF